MSDLLDETKDDYLYNKRVEIFKKVLPFVAIFTLIIISIISIKEWYADNQRIKIEKNTELLFEEFTNTNLKIDDKLEILKTLAEADGSVGDISRFKIVYNLVENKKIHEALDELRILIDKSSSEIFINLAKIEYAGLLLDENELTNKEKSVVQTYLSSIEKSQPLYDNAQIYTALYNIKTGNNERANEISQQLLQNEDSFESIREQAESIISYINKTK